MNITTNGKTKKIFLFVSNVSQKYYYQKMDLSISWIESIEEEKMEKKLI